MNALFEFILNFIKPIFGFKLLKKSLGHISIIEKKTLNEMQNYLNIFLSETQREENIIFKQIELMKIKYLNNLTYNELCFLSKSNIDLYGLIYVIEAKGNINIFSSIKWDEGKGIYVKNRINYIFSSMLVWVSIAFLTIGWFTVFMLILNINHEWIEPSMNKQLFPILFYIGMLLIAILHAPIMLALSNTQRIMSKLEKNYNFIFQPSP